VNIRPKKKRDGRVVVVAEMTIQEATLLSDGVDILGPDEEDDAVVAMDLSILFKTTVYAAMQIEAGAWS
jgi:hypothetical protein